MANNTSIEWTDVSWNIARGCSKVDADCKFCYMYRESLKGTRYDPKVVKQTKTVFDLPLKIKEPSKIFTCSLTDFFHEDCDAFRGDAWEIIRKCAQHTFQILTKRPERIKEHLPEFWPEIKDRVWAWVAFIKPNKIMFVSVEMPKYKCHKEVWALKIKSIHKDGEGENRETDGSAIITPEEEGYAPFKVDASFMKKHNPTVGGYYVVYEGGYKSFSPSEAFESGYSKIDNSSI